MTITITLTDVMRLREKVKAPDGVFDLRNVERAIMEEFGVSAKVAKTIVRQVDRARTGRAKTLAQYWTVE